MQPDNPCPGRFHLQHEGNPLACIGISGLAAGNLLSPFSLVSIPPPPFRNTVAYFDCLTCCGFTAFRTTAKVYSSLDKLFSQVSRLASDADNSVTAEHLIPRQGTRRPGFDD